MLNSSAALDVRFTGEARRVVLARGEVFFDVTHNPDLPFIVQAGSGEVRVLGTAFSVRRDGDDLLVTVERGRVQVSSGGHSSIL
ncbi:MAG: FecR domain-containing protein [Gammaproteobacteria bacterium]